MWGVTELAAVAGLRCDWPFSFRYAGVDTAALLTKWEHTTADEQTTWHADGEPLRVHATSRQFSALGAVEWLLSFENSGARPTELIEDVAALDLTCTAPLSAGTATAAQRTYRLHETAGGPAGPDDFSHREVSLGANDTATLTAGEGRSSHQHLPFFKVETGRGCLVVAIGWTGMWQARLVVDQAGELRLTAGLERTRFRLQPGEHVRGPRILLLHHPGDAWAAGNAFRALLDGHYVARPPAAPSAAVLFCNTCFTRGGLWLNECTADNQISLIKAYAPLGLAAVITDAGWFTGGWPDGAGNWDPRADAYPDGMAPVAAAAAEAGTAYGLWFEPERVMRDTTLHREHPDWLLAAPDTDPNTFLADFALPTVRDYYLEIIDDFMQLPGFSVYRQDFNMDPLPYWRANDAPDRVGVTEMRYIAGLYAFWEALAQRYPDSLRENCASGGNRLDLEALRYFPLHQKTDYWFRYETDQGALWGLSQYVPNRAVVAHLDALDTYAFHSTLAASLCLGWIADAPDFDFPRAQELADQYHAVKHLLKGDWYPLLPDQRGDAVWCAVQFHRADLDAGLLLAFRRPAAPTAEATLKLRGLDPEVCYRLHSTLRGDLGERAGADLRAGLPVTLDQPRTSDLIRYTAASSPRRQ